VTTLPDTVLVVPMILILLAVLLGKDKSVTRRIGQDGKQYAVKLSCQKETRLGKT
jgi:hypothetical protein